MLRLIASIFAITFLAAGTVSAQAPASSGLKISPVSSELTLQPGSSQTQIILIQNLTDQAISLRPVANNFTSPGDGSARPRLLLNPSDPAPANDFVSLVSGLAPLQIPARATSQFDLTLTAPKTASAGGYYGAIRFITDTPADGTTTSLAASSGTIFLVTVPGRLYQQLSLASSRLEGGWHVGSLYLRAPDNLRTDLRNIGNVHVQPFGTIVLRHDNAVERRQFNAVTPRGNVLPDSNRVFNTALTAGKQPGRYSVDTALSYGSGGQAVTAHQTYLYLPAAYLLVIPFLIFIIIVATILRRRKANALVQ